MLMYLFRIQKAEFVISFAPVYTGQTEIAKVQSHFAGINLLHKNNQHIHLLGRQKFFISFYPAFVYIIV